MWKIKSKESQWTHPHSTSHGKKAKFDVYWRRNHRRAIRSYRQQKVLWLRVPMDLDPHHQPPPPPRLLFIYVYTPMLFQRRRRRKYNQKKERKLKEATTMAISSASSGLLCNFMVISMLSLVMISTRCETGARPVRHEDGVRASLGSYRRYLLDNGLGLTPPMG